MSSFLYRLGRLVTRRPWRVLGAWVLLVILVAGAAVLLQRGTDDRVHIPGAESTEALAQLRQVFPELAGSGVVVVVEQPAGASVDAPAVRAAVRAAVTDLSALPHVVFTSDPFDPQVRHQISPDRRLAVVSAYLDVDALNVTAAIRASLTGAGQRLQGRLGGAARVHLGGDALSTTVPRLTATEGFGLVVALVVLLVTFGSAVAAGLPLLMAVLGAATTTGAIYLATAFTQVMSSAPVLALMLGLAVGIDYALFVLARHRDQLRDGEPDVAESVARATATAGSAVVVAGVTVMIALIGLFVAGIPFLTTMGLAAAAGVGVAVAISLTALPASLVLAGERLRPRPRPAPATRAVPATRPATGGPAARWVRRVTSRPLLTVLLVVGGLALCTAPAKDLRLSLPDGGALEPGAPPRVTHELLADHFGPGYNAPLLLMIDVLPSTDPVEVTRRIAAEVATLPGVAAVPVATPNRTGDTAVVQVVPTTAGDDPATARLVDRLRALAPGIRHRYGLDVAVTGLTAVTIDLSQRLAGALLPFALFVVGLSFVLLAAVFRSVAVPLSAALGYLLSVGAAFGVTSVVWMHGMLAGTLGVQHRGSVMAFLPILLMGVLFGLAMDYQMFLVSRMREHYVRQGDARAAVVEGFAASARVVTAAAVIMFGVFSFFVPEGTADTKPIAFGLAVGVLIDAFVVRMTLVPAVLALLGDRAWWLPRWVDVRLPVLDAEGQGMLRLAGTGDVAAELVVSADRVSVRDDTGLAVVDTVSFTLRRADVLIAAGPSATALLFALGGRLAALDGELRVCGELLPDRRRAVRRRAVFLPTGTPDVAGVVAVAEGRGVPLVLVDGVDRLTSGERRTLFRRLAATLPGDGDRPRPAVVLGCRSVADMPTWLADLPGATVLEIRPTHPDRRDRPDRPDRPAVRGGRADPGGVRSAPDARPVSDVRPAPDIRPAQEALR